MVERNQTLNRLFHALSAPPRRVILARLMAGECSVGELAAPLNMSLPAVTKHLKVLEECGLMQRRVQGRVHRCSLKANPLSEAAEWLENYRMFWEGPFGDRAGYLDALCERVANE
ncbi:MAG: metalloregulator ArsR/SmtB family transcription factor [Nitrospirota bacterium]|nr:metalloregulator ArsR/SmtB family transcription factor [Nitrospirota bacterium]